jgi:hypothetical protein
VIDFHQERSGNDTPDAVLGAVARLYDITADVLQRAARAGETPLQIADRIVHDRLDGGRRQAAAGI